MWMGNIYSLGELIEEQHRRRIKAAERVTDILQMAKMPDEAGLDVLGVGEHHTE
ncbi:hypothetical protein [Paenibacillus polymyxa]|uniref:hypothetical protein n=1 Tax=Paenibacillus polymyxa TaxID=1406 RepID=UPI000A54C874|nr:hypothetical protein [Paenibacillus polymyxa]